MNLIEGLTVLLSWQILATAIAIYAIMAMVKRFIEIYDSNRIEKLRNKKTIKIILVALPLLLGFIIALYPDFLPGNSLIERSIAGIVSGFLSNYFYQFIKRFFESKKV